MQVGLGSVRARETLAALRAKIASGEWPINGKIPPEPELTAMLGVGRTTVREAVRSLATLGMLETLPGIGTFVRSRTPVSTLLADWISDFAIDEILSYRRALEVEAAQLAAANRTEDELAALRAALAADTAHNVDYPARPPHRGEINRGRTPGQFHAAIFAAAKNRLLAGLYAGTLAALRSAVDSGEIGYASSNTARQDDHAKILVAIEDGDVAAAAQTMAGHADRGMVVIGPGTRRVPGNGATAPTQRPNRGADKTGAGKTSSGAKTVSATKAGETRSVTSARR